MKASDFHTRMSEERLSENIRAACRTLGWRFLWLRKTQHSSAGILDLLLIPLRSFERRRVLHRELKGHDRNGRLGRLSSEQTQTINELRAAGADAGLWTPADWLSGKILEELK